MIRPLRLQGYAAMVLGLVAMAGCGGGVQGTDAAADVTSDGVTDIVVPDASATDTGAPTDSPMCPPPESRDDGGIELQRVPSNFDTTPWIEPGRMPPSNAPDIVGAFRFICNASHLSYDDPIVFPCQPGRSHLHQFYGNSLANAYSTYESLRTTGESTCGNILNRSAYWIPAMMNGRGRVVVPDYVAIYYKRWPASSPDCNRPGYHCIQIPRGLRFVFGFNLLDGSQPATGDAWWNCDGPTGTQGRYHDLVEAASHCPPGNHLIAVVGAPNCWNGRDLDSPDHRSHVAYAPFTASGQVCPPTHPYIIPTFTIASAYTTDSDLDNSGTWTPGVTQTWYLSSDMSADGTMVRPGTSLHADWFGAWDDDTLERWTHNCIDGMLSCQGGELGDGTQLRPFPGFSFAANPRVVDPPPHP